MTRRNRRLLGGEGSPRRWCRCRRRGCPLDIWPGISGGRDGLGGAHAPSSIFLDPLFELALVELGGGRGVLFLGVRVGQETRSAAFAEKVCGRCVSADLHSAQLEELPGVEIGRSRGAGEGAVDGRGRGRTARRRCGRRGCGGRRSSRGRCRRRTGCWPTSGCGRCSRSMSGGC